MVELPVRVLRYGKDEALPEQRLLRAGPLTVLLDGGDLRYVRIGEREILRRVYVAVRDHNWDTIAPTLSNVRVDASSRSFRVFYTCEHRRGEVDFVWNATIAGDETGTISFSLDGEARSTFRRNRIGICVLHPARECAGAPFDALHEDGSTRHGTFPGEISPHQPVKDLAALSYEVSPGFWAEVRFVGDVFEMEDQRNWTDASFKTYSTPLRLPIPVEVPVGTRVTQSIVLTLRGEVPVGPALASRTTVTVGETPTTPVPRLGLDVASHGQALTPREIDRLKVLNLAHLRVDLCLGQPNHSLALRRAWADASALGVGLEIALFLSDRGDEELRALRVLLDEVRPQVTRWLIFHDTERPTSATWIDLARRQLTEVAPKAELGSGTNADFTELNRARPTIDRLDLVCYAVNPQVHAFDNLSLVETLETQATTVDSCRRFTDGRPIAITPITLKQRFNPVAIGPEPDPTPTGLPRPVDERQMALFGAAWTVGSVKYVGESGVASATYFETTGWRGVMEVEAGSPLPALFRSLPGAVFPIYHVLADVGEFAGGMMVPVRSVRPLLVDGLAVTREGKTRVILANLTNMIQEVRLDGIAATVSVRRLDESNAEDAMRQPEAFRKQPGEQIAVADGGLELQLAPYGIVRVDQLA